MTKYWNSNFTNSFQPYAVHVTVHTGVLNSILSYFSGSQLIQKQYMLTQKKLDKEVTDLEAERTQLKQTVKDVEAR